MTNFNFEKSVKSTDSEKRKIQYNRNFFIETNTSKLENQIENSIFVDFRKVFASVDHEVLLQNLYHIGVGGSSHKLLANYLADRFQYLRVDGKSSAKKPIKRGIPQGSILGIVTFLIFIDDLGADENWQSEIIKHADDTVLIIKVDHNSQNGICLSARCLETVKIVTA